LIPYCSYSAAIRSSMLEDGPAEATALAT
jgi:hypothetical protein